MPRSRDQKIPMFEQLKGAVLNYELNFSPWADAAGETISTASGSVLDSGGHVTLGTATVSSGVWTCPITASSVGTDTIEVTASTTSGAQTRKRRFRIKVTDPR